MFNLSFSSLPNTEDHSADWSRIGEVHSRVQKSRRSRRRRNTRKTKVEPITKMKHHDAPMTKNDLYFALDCEMVGIGLDGSDSAVARVTLLNWEKEIILDTFVKVPVTVTDYRTHVSGIQPQDIESENAMTFEEARRKVEHILRGKILIGHGLENDLCALGLTHPWCDIRDTACYAPYMRETVVDYDNGKLQLRPRKLRDLAWEKLCRQIQEDNKPHSPLEDAGAALDLYKADRAEWEEALRRQQAKEFQQMEQRNAKGGSVGTISVTPPFFSPYHPDPVPCQVPYDPQLCHGPHEPQIPGFSPVAPEPLYSDVEEKQSSRRWFRGRSKSPDQLKSPKKEDQEGSGRVPAARPMSPRSSGIFSFRRGLGSLWVQKSVSVDTTTTLGSEGDKHLEISTTTSHWTTDYSSQPDSNAVLHNSDQALTDYWQTDSAASSTYAPCSGHTPERSRLSTYLSITSQEAELGDDSNADVLELFPDEQKKAPDEQSQQKWQPPYYEASEWPDNNFHAMPTCRNNM